MRKFYTNIAAFVACLFLWVSCSTPFTPEQEVLPTTSVVTPKGGTNSIAAVLTETFETGTKSAYAVGDVVLGSGTWTFNEAVTGNLAGDAKTGTQSARVRNSGKLSMKFDKTGGAGTVTISHAAYGTDASGSWQLWYSNNAGSSYVQAGSTTTSIGNTLTTASFTINVSGNVRIEIRKTDGGTNRLNFDNISISDYSGTNPAPTLTGIAPASAVAGSGAVTLTVNGSNFISGSVVRWNGSNLSTTFVSATALTASVSASLLATAGTAQVTVFTPTPGGGTSTAANFTISPAAATGKKFLFDNKKGEMAGNADWVIDQDNGVPARFPTPAQSGITASTSETYWLGAISAWAVGLVKRGHSVETLPSSGTITYGNASNAQDLSNYHVFVIDEPNIRFTAAEKTAILQFVNNGGGVIMVSNHFGSDRNNDGWDGPEILNDLFTNNTVQANPFGFSVDLVSFSGLSSNVSTTTHPILNGVAGNVSQVEFNSGASITINPAVNASVTGLVWKSGVTKNNNNLLCASSTFGTGRAFIFGDSSPTDDGTGAAGNTLFNGWGVYSHANLLLNASLWVAKAQ